MFERLHADEKFKEITLKHLDEFATLGKQSFVIESEHFINLFIFASNILYLFILSDLKSHWSSF